MTRDTDRKLRANGGHDDEALYAIAESLTSDHDKVISNISHKTGCIPPSSGALAEIIKELRSVLFPGCFKIEEAREYNVSKSKETLDEIVESLTEQVINSLIFDNYLNSNSCTSINQEARATSIVEAFVSTLPHIQAMLATDVKAHYEGDPASVSPKEAILCYPGMTAITYYRLAHELHKLKVPFIPRMVTELAHSTTGIDIHPGAVIGKGFFIDHGTGIVIGETCIIGNNVRIYQGVTLGAKSFPLDANGNPVKGIERHPIIEDDVIIYSGSTLLGRIVIGKESIIGGNVWLTHDMPPKSIITQTKAHMEVFDNGSGV